MNPAIPAPPQTKRPDPDMVWIAGGTFRRGSDRHCSEEAPVHRVTVDGQTSLFARDCSLWSASNRNREVTHPLCRHVPLQGGTS
jgi:hypothetical protein